MINRINASLFSDIFLRNHWFVNYLRKAKIAGDNELRAYSIVTERKKTKTENQQKEKGSFLSQNQSVYADIKNNGGKIHDKLGI